MSTILGLELRRSYRDFSTIFFSGILPAFFFVIFGVSQSYSDRTVGNGNVSMMIMVTMGGYGAVTAAAALGSTTAADKALGWGRQLGLTPLSDTKYIIIRTLAVMGVVIMPLAIIYAIGISTNARGTALAWLLSAAVLLIGAIVFSLYGLCFGLALPPNAATSAAGGSVVILAFLGNVFFPLSGTLLTIAKFTPMYGYIALAKYPITEGLTQIGTNSEMVTEPLWIPATNLAAWLIIFTVTAVFLVQRSRSRQ